MQVKRIVVGAYRANCYAVTDDQVLVLVDPGSDFELLDQHISMLPQTLVAILITHGHFDHHGAVDALYQKYQVPVYVGEADILMLSDVDVNCGKEFGVVTTAPAMGVTTGSLAFGTLTFELLPAPGHTNGSTLYLLNQTYLFTGDVLFKGTIGRTDFPTGDSEQMARTLHQLRHLPPHLQILPGHGLGSTIAQELRENPYLCFDQN